MNCDILVIGAGILGLSSAYHLKVKNHDKRVIVLDMYSGPGQGNSSKSGGNFRNVFSSDTNYVLAESTINWFYHLQYNLGYNLKLAKTGYLWLFDEAQFRSLGKNFTSMTDRGVKLKIFQKEELQRYIPGLIMDFKDNVETELMDLRQIDFGVFGVDCGIFDVDALVRSYESEFLKLGGEVHYNTKVSNLILEPVKKLSILGEPFVWQDSHIVGVDTNKGEIRADTTVVAAGVWSERILDPIGFDALARPKKRHMFVFNDPKLKQLMEVDGLNQYKVLPFTILPKASIHLKVELSERSVWVGCADDLGRRYGLEDDPQSEEEYYTNNVYHALVKYLPCFQDIRPVNMWAGQYSINSFDSIPFITSIPGMIYVGATSGSGIMKCDALGRIVSALHDGEKETELYGDCFFNVTDLSVSSRNVERETFIL